jgi:DNA-binding NtrC family response regulator
MTHGQQAPGTRILEHKGAPALVLRRTSLTVLSGPDAGRELAIEGTSVRVGSDPDNDLILADETVSAHHFEILATEQGCLLRDLGSTNGTLVGGYRARELYLNDLTEIAAGNTRLRFALNDGEVQIPLSRRTNFGSLLGHSAAMRAAFAVLERAAGTDATVLVMGESGTGKELATRGLHDASKRREGPYVVFDCGAVTATLLESHLFGHARGAFTGAVDARAGVFEEADAGTLVLDEIGELPLDLQPKLLRALETRTVVRVGESKPREIDVRFLASTHRNLQEEVRAGRFREDLFFRLSVITVRLPPLRERRDEIPRLVHHFLTKLAADTEVPPSTMALFQSHDWPGNVRELRNAVERFVAFKDLGPEMWLPGRGAGAPARERGAEAQPDLDLPFHDAKQRWTDHFEREYLERLLRVHGGNLSEAARVAGLSRQTCYRLLKKHGLRAD